MTTTSFGCRQQLWSEDFFFFLRVEYFEKTTFVMTETSKRSHVTLALKREHAGCSATCPLLGNGLISKSCLPVITQKNRAELMLEKKTLSTISQRRRHVAPWRNVKTSDQRFWGSRPLLLAASVPPGCFQPLRLQTPTSPWILGFIRPSSAGTFLKNWKFTVLLLLLFSQTKVTVSFPDTVGGSFSGFH